MASIPDVIGILQKDRRKTINRFVFTALLVPVIVLVIAVLMYMSKLGPAGLSSDPAHWGQFGDYFGGTLNPLLAFFSLFALCATLVIQFIEASRSAKYNAIQKFDAMFFELLRIHRENLQAIDLWSDKPPRETRGRDCFSVFIRWIANNFESQPKTMPLAQRLMEAYRVFYEDKGRRSEVGHYFRTLYHIFKYVENSDLLTDEGKKMYGKIVRAQLSTPETGLLFFNGLLPRAANSREFIKKYALLQELEPADLQIEDITKAEIEAVYGAEAFHDQGDAA